MSVSPDIVILRIAREWRSLPVLRMVVSGVALRNDLPVDRLDDIQLALESLLAEEAHGEGELTLQVSASEGEISIHLDGLTNRSVKMNLLSAEPFLPSGDCLLDVRVLLLSLVDDYRVVEGKEGRFAVEMEKRAT